MYYPLTMSRLCNSFCTVWRASLPGSTWWCKHSLSRNTCLNQRCVSKQRLYFPRWPYTVPPSLQCTHCSIHTLPVQQSITLCKSTRISRSIKTQFTKTRSPSLYNVKPFLCQTPRHTQTGTTLLCTLQIPTRSFSTGDDGDDFPENLEAISADDLEELLRSDKRYQECVQEYYNIPNAGQRVFLIQPDIKWGPQKPLSPAQLQMEESIALVETLPNWKVVGKKIVITKRPNTMPVFGKGNFAELTDEIRNCPAVTAIFLSIEMLTGVQWSYLQKVWNIPVYDRYTIVLQIFKDHARTKEAKLQVALAEVPYIRSRVRSVHEGSMSTAGGGTQYIGGPGQSYLEIRYKYLQDRELKLKRALKKIRNQRQLLRKNRLKRQIPIIAVVGYTNAGKTCLIKALTNDADLQPVDQLFATLDVTAHAGTLPNHLTVIYMDTVGFISDIPTNLIEAFAATLEDAMIADVLIHVRDISHQDTDAQGINVQNSLRAMVTPEQLDNMIEVRNKVDLLPSSPNLEIDSTNIIYTDANSGKGIGKLKEHVQRTVLYNSIWKQRKFRIYMGSPLLQWLQQEASIVSAIPDSSEENLIVTAIITDSAYYRFKAEFKKQRRKD